MREKFAQFPQYISRSAFSRSHPRRVCREQRTGWAPYLWAKALKKVHAAIYARLGYLVSGDLLHRVGEIATGCRRWKWFALFAIELNCLFNDLT